MLTDVRVAQLLCSRLCHDLVAPVGAVSAGAELLEERSGEVGEVVELIAGAGRRLACLLDVFRIAFGLRGGGDATAALAEARALSVAFCESSDRVLDWPADGNPDADLDRPRPVAVVRLLLCLIVAAAGMLPRRGTIAVRVASDAAALHLAVRAVGIRGIVDRDLAAALSGTAEAGSLTARTVHGYLAAGLAACLGTTIRVASEGGQVALETTVPPSPAAGA